MSLLLLLQYYLLLTSLYFIIKNFKDTAQSKADKTKKAKNNYSSLLYIILNKMKGTFKVFLKEVRFYSINKYIAKISLE